MVWKFIIDAFTTSNFRGTSRLGPQPVDGDLVCTTAVSLNDLRSPYHGTTVGKSDTHTPSCGGGGNDQVFRFSLPAGSSLSIGQTRADFAGTAELAVGGSCPGSTSIHCEGGSDSGGHQMTYDNTGSTAVDVYFMVDAGGPHDADFTIEWVSSGIATTSEHTTNPCLRDPGLCLSFVNEEVSLETCERVLADREGRVAMASEAKATLRAAYAKAGGRTLPGGEVLSDPFLRCGGMWVDMPVPARDRSALRAHFRRQQLGLLVDGMRVQFRLAATELTGPATAPPLAPRQNGPVIMFTQGRVADVSPGALVIAIFILSLLLLGAGAAVGFLLFRRKRKTEPTNAAAGDGHVYAVEAEAVSGPSPVPVADEVEGQVGQHEMEFDKSKVQFAPEASPGHRAAPLPTPIAAEVVSYRRNAAHAAAGDGARALSAEEAAVWKREAARCDEPHPLPR